MQSINRTCSSDEHSHPNDEVTRGKTNIVVEKEADTGNNLSLDEQLNRFATIIANRLLKDLFNNENDQFDDG